MSEKDALLVHHTHISYYQNTYLPTIEIHSFPKLAHSFLLSTCSSHPVFFPSISTSFDWLGLSNCKIPTPTLLLLTVPDDEYLPLLHPAAPSTEYAPITPASPMAFRLRTLLVAPGIVLTDDEIAAISLYSSPDFDTPKKEQRVSDVL